MCVCVCVCVCRQVSGNAHIEIRQQSDNYVGPKTSGKLSLKDFLYTELAYGNSTPRFLPKRYESIYPQKCCT